MNRSRLAFVACVFVLLSVGRSASAQQTPLENAKELFRQGNELRKAGDCARALSFYLASRSLVPSVANTTNSAVCLAELRRDDEALEMYEELLVKFRVDLGDEEARALTLAASELRAKLGRLEVSSNVQGLLVVDGRTRGQLPLLAPIPVKPGARVVRVIKDGYETSEQTVTVAVGTTLVVDAKLTPLAHAGRLRLAPDAQEDLGADVVVDGAVLGRTPWEGALTPGAHVLVLVRGSRGTAPIRATVVEDQTVVLAPALLELGPALRIVTEPSSAILAIDGVDVGRGEWRGALPRGPHQLEAREEAYLSTSTIIDVTDAALDVVTLRLDVDPAHARWNSRRPGRIWVEAWGGPAVSASLGSGAEASCDRLTCSARSSATGGAFGARVGYELASGLSFQLGFGYLALRTSLSRHIDATYAGSAGNVPLGYDLRDTVDLAGPFATAGLGFALPLGEIFEVAVRGELGAVLVSGRDAVTGTVSGGGRTLDLAIENAGDRVHAAAPFFLPELQARARFSRFYVGAGAALAVLFVAGPSLATGAAAPAGFDCAGHPGTADCAPASGLVRGERAFGPSLVWLPNVEIGARF